MIAAHFRSKVSDDPDADGGSTGRSGHREKTRQSSDAAVILGGDLNDTPGSAPTQHLESVPELLRVANDRPPASGHLQLERKPGSH